MVLFSRQLPPKALRCGCTFTDNGKPLYLCREATLMQDVLHRAIGEWDGKYEQDKQVCQLCAEFFGHLEGE